MRKHMLLKKTSAFLLAVSLTVYGGTGGLNLRNMWNVPVEAAEIIQTGSCGESATYTLDGDGVLTITGTGGVALDVDLRMSDLIKKTVIEDKITSIGYDAFYGCSSLTDIVILDSVTSIGDSAFSGCSSLTDIVIPDSVTSIGDSAFSGCSSLTDIQVDVSNPLFTSDNGVLFNHNKTTLICCPARKSGSYSIPDSVTEIESYAFYGCSSLTDIVIPDSVTSIGNGAFWGCSSLTDIVIPDSVTFIGYSAFYGCSSLAIIEIPNTVKKIGFLAFGYAYDVETGTDIKIPNFTIYGFLDSEAERYANTNDFNFVPLLTTTEGITAALEDEETAKTASALTLTTKEITDTATDTSVDYRLLDELIENTVKTLTPDAAADVTYKAYDIVLLDADGHQTQPQGSISVRIPLPSGCKADTCHIYRLEEDNTFTDMKATCFNDVLTFRTNHFSIYVITEQTLEDASALISGDVNGDGEVDIADALLISRYDAKLTEFDATQLAYADVNDDNEVNIADALLISRYDAKLIDSLSGK